MIQAAEFSDIFGEDSDSQPVSTAHARTQPAGMAFDADGPALYTDVRLPKRMLAGHASCQTVFSSLEELVENFHARPSKKFRSHLVEAGLRLVQDKPQARELTMCQAIGEALEAIHAGSLIVDDIQDQSDERRGAPTLHKKYGTPLALNAGNWLYFKSFELIRETAQKFQMASQTELRLYRLCHQVMLDAHVGQALDLGAKISETPRESVTEICISSLRLKTGALMALALGSGAILAHASDEMLEKVLAVGSDLGVSLQMFDDLGNFTRADADPKRFEDLYLNRPSWLWAAIAQNSTDQQYQEFLSRVSELPNETGLNNWLHDSKLLPQAKLQAQAFSKTVMTRFENIFHPNFSRNEARESHDLRSKSESGDSTSLNLSAADSDDTSSARHIVQDLLERIQISYG